VSSCDTTLTQRSGPIILKPANAPDGTPGNTFYRIAPDGTLQMSHHAPNGTFDMVNQTIGWGWNAASKVFAAEGGHVYAIMPNGDLRYYHHGTTGGWDNWGTVIGTDWHVFAKVFAGRFGEIYAIQPNGNLYLYKHNSALQFTSSALIGSGWNVPTVFTGGHGALYIVAGNGDLLYYYHDDNNNWIHTNMKIGTGWNVFATLGSTGNGEIYGVTPAGALLFYRHDVDKVWQSGSGGQIGSGWDFGGAGLLPAAY
jgi:Tachylectin